MITVVGGRLTVGERVGGYAQRPTARKSEAAAINRLICLLLLSLDHTIRSRTIITGAKGSKDGGPTRAVGGKMVMGKLVGLFVR